MLAAMRYRMAKRKAETFLADQGIASLPVDPIAIAESLDIVVEPKPDTAGGVSGMLVRHQDVFGIMYATHIDNDGFQRFSIAHEIGHYVLDGHVDHIFPSGDGLHASEAGFVSGDRFELEADHFAAGLLMPDPHFSREVLRFGDGLEAVEGMARKCRTSLTATAIRYAETASVPVAVVMSAGGTVDYCFMSKSIQDFDGLEWLRKGQPLPAGVETDLFNRDPDNILRARRSHAETDLRDWFGGPRSMPGTEETIGLGRYGK
ncbi:MAG: ImmA/IrrE family metallo-endopeptidase, partial [Alphaproteobacteria bacterium]|nr:ImmA/IrrE family metallo-endopeptidase [Alphaproteobacteria bacterium]